MEYVYSLREGLPRLPTYAEKSSKGLNLIVRAFDGERGGGGRGCICLQVASNSNHSRGSR